VQKHRFFPASIINYDSFSSLFFIPIELVRGILAISAAGFIWRYYERIKGKVA